MIKGTLHQEDITLINIYAPNTGAPKFVKQLLIELKEDINNNTIIVGDLNTPLTPMDRTSRQKIRSEEHTSELQSRQYLVCRLLLEKKKKKKDQIQMIMYKHIYDERK